MEDVNVAMQCVESEEAALKECTSVLLYSFLVLLEYPTTFYHYTVFKWGYLKNGPYTYTVSGGNGRVF